MCAARLGGIRLAGLALLSAVALLPGLGSSRRLTYHEAFVAQGSREILASGEWAYPTIGGLPWLEKPPLPWWLTAALGYYTGGVNETIARLPSVLATFALVLGVTVLATRHYGPTIGLLAGAIQATTGWTVIRGRLAEADMLLACLITWTIVAFDQLLTNPGTKSGEGSRNSTVQWRLARWVFFAFLGITSLVKGIGFGTVLTLAIVAGVLLWQRDIGALRRLQFPGGWVLTVVLTLAWPLSMVAQHGSGTLALWIAHVANRLSSQAGPGPFASEPWWEYVPALLAQAMPWTPLALVGAWRSLGRSVFHRCVRNSDGGAGILIPASVIAGDRLLWVWAVMPLALLALATVKNAHYAISAQVPWSVWAALSMAQLANWVVRRVWDQKAVLVAVRSGFATLSLAYGLVFAFLSPRFDRRGLEWAFYESAGRQVAADIPLVLLYDDWDRNAYESPFGPMPHDLAVRLFYLSRPACWHMASDLLTAKQYITGQCSASPPGSIKGTCLHGAPRLPFAVLGRARDLAVLNQVGNVQVIAHGPRFRRDRAYDLFLVTPGLTPVDSSVPIANSEIPHQR